MLLRDHTERIYADMEYLQQHRRPQAVIASGAKQSDAPTALRSDEIRQLVHVHKTPYAAMENAHAIAILTEWDETKFDEVNSAPTPTWNTYTK
jgi:UDPglucose 6-dehydrogenase